MATTQTGVKGRNTAARAWERGGWSLRQVVAYWERLEGDELR